jgi:hypothetical protein
MLLLLLSPKPNGMDCVCVYRMCLCVDHGKETIGDGNLPKMRALRIVLTLWEPQPLHWSTFYEVLQDTHESLVRFCVRGLGSIASSPLQRMQRTGCEAFRCMPSVSSGETRVPPTCFLDARIITTCIQVRDCRTVLPLLPLIVAIVVSSSVIVGNSNFSFARSTVVVPQVCNVQVKCSSPD